MRHRKYLGPFALLLLAASVLVLVPTAASAYRSATPTQRRAIRGVVARRWRSEATIPCPTGGSDRFVLRGASISTADPRFAEASIDDSGCTYTLGYILRRRSRHGGRWRIVYRLLDSVQSCHALRARAPEPVVRDFGLEGTAGDTGVIGSC